jgi:integrase
VKILDKTSRLFVSRVFRKSRSKSSVHTYLLAVKQFAKFKGYKSLTSLARGIQDGTVNMVKDLNSWLDELDQRNCSPQTQIVYYAAVKKFVQVVLPDLEFKWKHVDLPTVYRVEEDRIPTKEELKSLMYHGTLKDKTIITFAASSGVRENTLASLRVGDVDLETYEDVGVVYVKPLAAIFEIS